MKNYKDDLLLHDGQPGMHWGVRKYRNYDGTLTEAGRQRYGVGSARSKSNSSAPKKKLTRSERKAQKEITRKASAKEAERKAKEMIEEARRASEEAKKEREALEKEKVVMEESTATAEGNYQLRLNNDKLKMRIEKIELERKYNQLVNPTKQKIPVGKRVKNFMAHVHEFAAFGKDISTISEAVRSVANITKMKKDKDSNSNSKFN